MKYLLATVILWSTLSSANQFDNKKVVYEDPMFATQHPGYIPLLDAVYKKIKKFDKHGVLLKALVAQNNEKISFEEIKRRDEEWTKTLKSTPTKKMIEFRRSSGFLKRLITHKHSEKIVEIFLTDNQGANVAAYPLTSDYWQGDEDKWLKAYNKGDCRIFIGKIDYDESADSRSIQISVPMENNAGKCLGVIIVGVRELYLRKQLSK